MHLILHLYNIFITVVIKITIQGCIASLYLASTDELMSLLRNNLIKMTEHTRENGACTPLLDLVSLAALNAKSSHPLVAQSAS